MWSNWRLLRWFTLAAMLSSSIFSTHAEEPNLVARLKALGLPTLSGKVLAYYSSGHREHAQKLQAAIEDMNVFYRSRLGVQADVSLALLNAEDWKRVTGSEYSLPQVEGSPPVILMPATSDNPVFGLIESRKDAIPQEQLQTFLKNHDTTFAAVVADFVDIIGFHELGHTLNDQFGIDSQNLWFNEFLATYWSYSYISEGQPEWKSVFALLGRPSSVRPKNTSLEDFERLYTNVDDYGWYQGMFERRVQEICPRLGLKFLRDLKQKFPRKSGVPWDPKPLDVRMKPNALLEQLEKIAPGFQKWAEGFQTAPKPAAGQNWEQPPFCSPVSPPLTAKHVVSSNS
jgi:hypothetical protein